MKCKLISNESSSGDELNRRLWQFYCRVNSIDPKCICYTGESLIDHESPIEAEK